MFGDDDNLVNDDLFNDDLFDNHDLHDDFHAAHSNSIDQKPYDYGYGTTQSLSLWGKFMNWLM